MYAILSETNVVIGIEERNLPLSSLVAPEFERLYIQTDKLPQIGATYNPQTGLFDNSTVPPVEPEPEPSQDELNAQARAMAKDEPSTITLDGTGYSVNEAAAQVQYLQQYDAVAGTTKADELNTLYVQKAMEIDAQYPVTPTEMPAGTPVVHIPTTGDISDAQVVTMMAQADSYQAQNVTASALADLYMEIVMLRQELQSMKGGA